jgi:hypothetical protein
VDARPGWLNRGSSDGVDRLHGKDGKMSDQPICPKCGYEGPPGAEYCARCGRKLKRTSVGIVEKFNRWIDSLTPTHLGMLGWILLIPVGSLSEYLIVWKLSFGFSVFLMALMIGCGCAYLGWEFLTLSSPRKVLSRCFILISGLLVSLLVIYFIDQALLPFTVNGTESVIYRMPGVYAESSVNTRRVVIDNTPSYWLLVIVYGVGASVIGNIIHRARNSFLLAAE